MISHFPWLGISCAMFLIGWLKSSHVSYLLCSIWYTGLKACVRLSFPSKSIKSCECNTNRTPDGAERRYLFMTKRFCNIAFRPALIFISLEGQNVKNLPSFCIKTMSNMRGRREGYREKELVQVVMEFKNCKQDFQTNYEYWYSETYGAKMVFQVKNHVYLNDLPFWKISFAIFTARKRSLRRLCFYRCLSVHTGGACVVLFGGVCMVLLGGVCGFIWGCVVLFGGHAWFYSGGCAWFYLGGSTRGFIWGACVVLFGGACMVFSVFSDTMRYGQWVGGTHPTGMHSCI